MTNQLEHHTFEVENFEAAERGRHRGGSVPANKVLTTLARRYPEEGDGIDLLNDLASVFSQYVILPSGGAEAAALWTVHAHAHDAATISPILAITSPEMRCGKTTMLEILQALTPKSILTSNVTAPALFRLVDRYSPTLLVDEADTFLKNQEQMRGILNSGHRRSSATIIRIDAGRVPRPYGTWAPKVIGCIGNLPDTLADRSVAIRLQRKRREDIVEHLRFEGLAHLRWLRSRLSRWAQEHLEELRIADPEIPRPLHDRAADNWRALFAIAEAVGGSWPERARSAAVRLSGNREEAETTAAALLADIREVFTDIDRMESRLLVSALASKEGSPWAEWRGGRPITVNQLAVILAPFGISPKTVRFGNRTAKGYLLEHFREAFERYAPSER